MQRDRAQADIGRATQQFLRVLYTGSLTNDAVYFYLGDDCDNASVVIDEVCYELAALTLATLPRSR